jgi:hypothetical protein
LELRNRVDPFAFDALAAMSSNFLFLSAAEADSVFAMISVDLVGNLVMTIKVTLLVNKHEKAKIVARMDASDARVDALERERAKLATRVDTFGTPRHQKAERPKWWRRLSTRRCHWWT